MPKNDTTETADTTTITETVSQPEPDTQPETVSDETQGQPEPGPETAKDTAQSDETLPPPTAPDATPQFAGLDRYVPSPEDRRQRALELAAYGGAHGIAHEPIKSVLARAEAYRNYVETGETGITE